MVQHHGVVAWLRAWHGVPVAAARTPSRREATVVPATPGLADRLVEALASMALAAAGR